MNLDFKARWYQIPIIQAWNPDNPDRKNRFLLCHARRTGKDYLAWHIAIWECLRKRQIVFYIFPTFNQARSVIWNSMTIDGRPFLSFIPEFMIAKKNEARMEITFKNGSILALKGSSNIDSLRGNNCSVAFFSEYADCDPEAWQLVINPVIRACKGDAWFLSTPKGHNHFYQLTELAKHDERWFYDLKTVEDTGHIDIQEIERDIATGIISREQARQEFWCDFSRGRAGQLFGNELARMRLDNRITYVPYQEGHLVHCSFDLGWDDETFIIWFQVIGKTVNIIDAYSNRQQTLAHYAQVIYSKGYTYGKIFLPHDARQANIQTGTTREDTLYDLGLNIERLPIRKVIDRLELGRQIFANAWIDEKKCDTLLRSLEHYHREWNEKMGRYNEMPVHDWSSHGADCWTYMAIAIKEHRFSSAMTQDDINALKMKAKYGQTNEFDSMPRLTNPNMRY